MTMKRIYLVRHCKATGQEPTAALTEEGRLQAEALVDFFAERAIGYVMSSPFERAVCTIRPFASKAGLHIHTDDRLSERVLSSHDLPDWMDKLQATFEDLHVRQPGGESSQEAMDRGIRAIEELFDRPETNAIAVTHGNLMSLILKHYDNKFGFEDWRNLSNPDVFELNRRDPSSEITINRIWEPLT